MKRHFTIILAVSATTSLGIASVAEAHKLPAKVAQKGANKFGKKVAQQYVNENPDRAPATYQVDPCSRKSEHRLVCMLHVFGTDSDTGQPYDCHADIVVQASKSNFTYSTKLANRKAC